MLNSTYLGGRGGGRRFGPNKIWLNEKSEHDLAHIPNEEEEYSAQFFYYGHFHNNVISTYCYLNPLPDKPILGSSNSAAKKKYDVKNMDKWGYNHLIE